MMLFRTRIVSFIEYRTDAIADASGSAPPEVDRAQERCMCGSGLMNGKRTFYQSRSIKHNHCSF